MMIRKIRAQDTEALGDVYRDAVRSLGPLAYSREQVEVWATWPDDVAKFTDRVSRGLTLVAEVDHRILAFGQLEPEDHLALIFCRGSASRQGLCSQIYRALEAHAFSVGVEEIRTEASRIGRPFFEKHGFLLREVELWLHRGIQFERFRMAKNRANKPRDPTLGSVTPRAVESESK